MAPGEDDLNRGKELEEIVSGFDEKEKLKKEELKGLSKRKEFGQKQHFFLQAIAICAIIVMAFNLMLGFINKEGIFRQPRYWAVGKGFITDRNTEDCIGNMWQIRKAIELYYEKNKKYPPNMQALYAGGFLKKKVKCPATGNEYELKVVDNEKVFYCPNPGKHRAGRLWCNVKDGVPTVERIK